MTSKAKLEPNEIRLDWQPGTIYGLLRKAHKQVVDATPDTTVSFDLNGRIIKVKQDTDLDLIMRDFWRPASVTGDTIGPYPDPTETELDRSLALDRGSNFASLNM